MMALAEQAGLAYVEYAIKVIQERRQSGQAEPEQQVAADDRLPGQGFIESPPEETEKPPKSYRVTIPGRKPRSGSQPRCGHT